MSVKRHKVVLLGASSVGKTSIVIRFSKGVFSPGQESTIGAAFVSREIQTDHGSVSLHIWDTAGQERYRSLVPRYSQGAAAIVVVYDVSDNESFRSAQRWVAESRDNHPPGVVWFLIANKCDLPQAVDAIKAQEYANSESLNFLETSAKTGQNISELFFQIAKLVPSFPPAGTDPREVDVGSPPAGTKCC
jgi:Ras-related protein Rab-5C